MGEVCLNKGEMLEPIFYSDGDDFIRNWDKLVKKTNYITPFYSDRSLTYFSQRPKDEGKILKDASLLLCWEGIPVIGFRGALVQDGSKVDLLAYEMPCASVEDKGNITIRATKEFIKEFSNITSQVNGTIWYRDFLIDGELSKLSRKLLLDGAKPSPEFWCVLDLFEDEKILRKRIRKSYFSLINWGCRELNPKVISGHDLKWEQLDEFRKLHIRESGKVTRSEASWRRQLEIVNANEGFLVTGSYNGELVVVGMFMFNNLNCYYFNSAAKRDLFKNPLFHAVMWTAILHAKKIGCRWFEVGHQMYPNYSTQINPNQPADKTPSKKELSISDFKAGFGGETRMILDLKLECLENKNDL
jgi:hypothetical protein